MRILAPLGLFIVWMMPILMFSSPVQAAAWVDEKAAGLHDHNPEGPDATPANLEIRITGDMTAAALLAELREKAAQSSLPGKRDAQNRIGRAPLLAMALTGLFALIQNVSLADKLEVWGGGGASGLRGQDLYAGGDCDVALLPPNGDPRFVRPPMELLEYPEYPADDLRPLAKEDGPCSSTPPFSFERYKALIEGEFYLTRVAAEDDGDFMDRERDIVGGQFTDYGDASVIVVIHDSKRNEVFAERFNNMQQTDILLAYLESKRHSEDSFSYTQVHLAAPTLTGELAQRLMAEFNSRNLRTTTYQTFDFAFDLSTRQIYTSW